MNISKFSNLVFPWLKLNPSICSKFKSCTTSVFIGSAIIPILFLLFKEVELHLNEEVSKIVSLKLTTGSLTFISISLYIFLKSFNILSKYNSPVPIIIFSPLSSTFVFDAG